MPFEINKWENSRPSEQKPDSNCSRGFIVSYSNSKPFHRMQDTSLWRKLRLFEEVFFNTATSESSSTISP